MRRHSSLDLLDSIAYFRTFDFVHFILYLIMGLLLLSYDFIIILFGNIFLESEQILIIYTAASPYSTGSPLR